MATLTRPLDAGLKRLHKEAKEHEALIAKIKEEVSQGIDNLNHPVPLFQQLQTISA